jgi:ribosomal protein S18 acetylase RimI-like enzyme
MIIRPATTDDHDRLCELFAQVDALHREAHPSRFRPLEPPRTVDFLHSAVADERSCLRIAVEGDEVVGFVHGLLRDVPADTVQRPRTFLYVDTMGVSSGTRRRGVGRALLDEALAWGRSRGATEVVLDVYDFNRGAIAFYEAAGFTPLLRRMARPL